MNKLDNTQILKLGKKYKKWNEDVTIDIFPYLIENNRYYLAYYHGKFSKDVKEIAIVSPDNLNSEQANRAIKPLVYFTVTFGKLCENTGARVKLQMDIFEEILDYLGSVLKSGLLDQKLEEVYKRSYQVIQEILDTQEEMIKLGEKVNNMSQRILDRGYFVEQEIDEALALFPAPGWLQYKQFEKSYIYRHDFDIFYENSKKPNLISYHKFKDEKTLYNMTSGIAEGRLRESLNIVTDNMDMSNFSEEDYYSYWITKFKSSLADRYEELRKKVRYPKVL
ncbi:hypothetical protein [Ornithinibacillus scapharcae]|uniref:hypothetical protein n=1 Tax=Ornithinibacillus scapharcae TaxID=1147159 RepID=UPI000225BC1E|nr:hypothetical protein [Ornithinibacillus scapharcae]